MTVLGLAKGGTHTERVTTGSAPARYASKQKPFLNGMYNGSEPLKRPTGDVLLLTHLEVEKPRIISSILRTRSTVRVTLRLVGCAGAISRTSCV